MHVVEGGVHIALTPQEARELQAVLGVFQLWRVSRRVNVLFDELWAAGFTSDHNTECAARVNMRFMVNGEER